MPPFVFAVALAADFIPGLADLSYLFFSSFIAATGIELARWLWMRHKRNGDT